jgi:GNAT superfamily N-acetyltransferase
MPTPVPFDLAGDLAGWHAAVAAAAAHDRPGDPPLTPAETTGWLTSPVVRARRRAWVVTEGDRTVGVALLRLLDEPGKREHAYLEQVVVRPDHRRRGAGTALLRAVAAELAVDGRTGVEAFPAAAATVEPFAARYGFRAVLDVEEQLLRRAEVDWAALPRGLPAGYEFVRWTGLVPADMAAPLAEVKNAMADAPTGDSTAPQHQWDADRVLRDAEMIAGRGITQYTVAAVHAATGAIAAFTQVEVIEANPVRAGQGDTIAARAHRGHGLGLAVKAELHRWLRDTRPEVAEVATTNAAENTHMLAVNTRLGYRPYRVVRLYETTTAELEKSLSS